MNDPGRIRDLGLEGSPALKDLFVDAQKPEPLPPATDARLSAQIAAMGTLPALSLVKVMPWLVGGGAMLLAGAMTLIVQRRAPLPQAVPAVPEAMAAPAPVAQDPTLAETARLQAPALEPKAQPSNAGRSASAEASSAPEDALAGEANLLNQAHVAMSTDPRKALTIASEHARRYPHGQLAAERELILVQALVKLGRAREAEARGRALRKSTPNSIYGDRLDTILHGR